MPTPSQNAQDIAQAIAMTAGQQGWGAGGILSYLPRSLRNRVFDPFVYTADFSAAVFTSLSTPSVPISIQADSHFLCTAINATTFDTTGQTQQTSQLWKVQISDSGSGRNWFAAPVFGNAITGIGQLPFPLMPPKLVKAAATVNIALTSTDTANAHVVQVQLIGFKVFKMLRDTQVSGNE